MGVRISCRLQFLVVFCVGVELRPYAYHEAAMQVVNIVKHLLGIRITLLIELMASPLVRFPILPVLDDIVNRDMPAPHFGQGFHQLFLGGIPLVALPESQCPLGHHLGLPGQSAVAPDHSVIVISRNEIEVCLRLKFGPEADPGFFLRGLQGRHPESYV